MQLHHGEGAVHTNVNKTFPTVVMLPFSSTTSKTNKLDQLVTTTSHSHINQSQTSAMTDKDIPWKILAALAPYVTVSHPTFQATDFSAMNINHALIRLESVLSNPSSRIRPPESILLNPSSRLFSPINHQPLAKSVPDLPASTIPFQRSHLWAQHA